MSETPRNPDDEAATTDPSPTDDTISEPERGSSAFDEPTARIPVGGTRQPESQSEDFDHFDSIPPASTPTQEFEAPRGRVLSTESDLMEGDDRTQRTPPYEELSAPRREPQAVAEATDERVADRAPVRRGTLDLGLLLIRVVLGLILVAHGLQKITGRWGGPDLSEFQTDLQTLGFDYSQQLAYIGSIGEVIVGAVLVLGLFTPIAGAAAVALLINAWAAAQAADPGLQFFVDQSGNQGVEFETMLLAAAAGLCLTGAGKLSLDANRGWTHRPMWGSLTLLVIGIAAGVATWAVLNGSNPFA